MKPALSPPISLVSVAILSSFVFDVALGQGPPPPPPPPPLQPLNPPPVPAGNPITEAKANLGKALFWDEQLSATRTISCGSCHQPESGGSDPRSLLGDPASTHPGADGIFGTADDVTGSPGVILNREDGTYDQDDFFGMTRQVTGRYTPSAINAGYASSLFWDGRATSTFRDPVTNAVILNAGAALESQAAGPPVSSVEMAHQGRDWGQIEARVAGSKPLAVAASLPTALETWIAGRNYPALFEEVFGDSTVTAARIIMAIATYERTLFSNQAPIDAFIAGNTNALTAQEQQGLDIFRGIGRCAACHGGSRFTDDDFHYIGVRPVAEDLGRFAVTGANADRGRMKTPSLRNVGLRGEFMHNGRFATLTDVVNFYDRGGDFNAPNRDPAIGPIGLTIAQRNALVAFLTNALTDPRVASEAAPFDRPVMFEGSGRQAFINGSGTPRSTGLEPRIVATEPPLSGNPSFTIGLDNALGGAESILVIDDAPIGDGSVIPAAGEVKYRIPVTLAGNGAGNGFGSVSLPIPGEASLVGRTWHARWYVLDAGAAAGVAASATATFSVFGASAGVLAAPANLSASDGDSEEEVTLSWEAASGAVSYEIFRGPDSNFANALRLGNSAVPSYADTTADPGETWSYFVVAVSATESSAASAPDTGFVAVTLSPVTGLSASDGTFGDKVRLSWTAVDGATVYRVYRGETDAFGDSTDLGTVLETT
ncbi:MAG: hypothetical protein KDM64_03015, partial [Verrucomicrobiae bacterium]|nr:hypothetical protein [Verrucomicrobiae bacterium]